MLNLPVVAGGAEEYDIRYIYRTVRFSGFCWRQSKAK
jgi:hypothetical protein